MPDHPPWRRLLAASLGLAVLVVLSVLAFAWPAARTAPRELPVGVVGTGAASQTAVAQLSAAEPGAFDLHLYPDAAAAEHAIVHREVYGAFVVTPNSVTVLDASAAGPVVADLLGAVGHGFGARADVPVRTVDVVPLSSADPRGVVFSSALLPLTICGVIIAGAVGLLFRFRPAWRQLTALAVIAAVAALGAYLVAQGFLGALPHHAVETWAALALAIFAIASATAGFLALVGASGLAVAALTMVFVGNPFSGVNSAPDLLPSAVDHLGQWLPPGATANLLRSTAYFDGNGSGSHLAVLVAWAVLGTAAIVVGHHRAERIGEAARDETEGRRRYVCAPESVTG
jgi:hypothetical protein